MKWGNICAQRILGIHILQEMTQFLVLDSSQEVTEEETTIKRLFKASDKKGSGDSDSSSASSSSSSSESRSSSPSVKKKKSKKNNKKDNAG